MVRSVGIAGDSDDRTEHASKSSTAVAGVRVDPAALSAPLLGPDSSIDDASRSAGRHPCARQLSDPRLDARAAGGLRGQRQTLAVCYQPFVTDLLTLCHRRRPPRPTATTTPRRPPSRACATTASSRTPPPSPRRSRCRGRICRTGHAAALRPASRNGGRRAAGGSRGRPAAVNVRTQEAIEVPFRPGGSRRGRLARPARSRCGRGARRDRARIDGHFAAVRNSVPYAANKCSRRRLRRSLRAATSRPDRQVAAAVAHGQGAGQHTPRAGSVLLRRRRATHAPAGARAGRGWGQLLTDPAVGIGCGHVKYMAQLPVTYGITRCVAGP